MPPCASIGRPARSSLAKGEDYILYAILDFIVDNYMPVLETIQDEVEAIEDRVLPSTLTGAEIERLYMLRRDLLRLRNAVGAAGRRLPAAEHAELPPIGPAMQPLFRDVTDHIRTRAGEDRQPARGAGLRLRGEPDGRPGQETAIATRLASWAAILAVPTAIAGIYGMNFEHMPELKWAYGYYRRDRRHRRHLRHSLCALPPQRLAVVDRGRGRPIVARIER